MSKDEEKLSPLEKLRKERMEKREFEKKQTYDYMIEVYLEDKVKFVENAFDLCAPYECNFFRISKEHGTPRCAFSEVFRNSPSNNCRYRYNGDYLINSILNICTSPNTKLSRYSASQVIDNIYNDGFLTSTICKKKSGPGIVAFAFMGLGPNDSYRSYMFDVEKICKI